MQNEKFIELLEKSEEKIKNKKFTENDMKEFTKEVNKVTIDSNEIYERINNVRRRAMETTRWNLLISDIEKLEKSKYKNNEEFKNIMNFINEIERVQISLTNKDLNLLKKNYKSTLSKAKKFMDEYLLSNFQNEVDKKMRVLESKLKRTSSNNFNTWLKKTIKNSGLSLKEISEKTGISVSYLYRLESTNETIPSKKILDKLSKVLKVKVNEFPVNQESKEKPSVSSKRKKAKKDEITKTNIREKNRDLFEILSNENIQINKRTLNEEEREALKGCLMFMFDKTKDLKETLRFLNQVAILK